MRSYRLTSVWGIPIRINISLIVFLPILAWLIGSGQQIALYAGIIDGLAGSTLDVAVLRQGATPWLIGAAAALGLFVSVTIHELGHSWVALRYRLTIESITLWIFGGVASMTSMPREWNREFWIAIAGPITSVLLGVVCYILLQIIPASLPIVLFVVGWLAVANVTLAIFNLVPAFPMDGGRVFRALLARTRPYGQATRVAARVGVIFALVFAVIGVFSFNVILLFVALFIYGAATSESRTTALEDLLVGVTVADIMTPDSRTISATSTVAEFVDQMLVDRRTEFGVTDEAGATVGIVSLQHLKDVGERNRETTPVADVMAEEPLTVPATADAFDTLAELGTTKTSYALVEEDGAIVGILSQADYAGALELRRGIGTVGEREQSMPMTGTGDVSASGR
ncbi:site-2 protease family protein [Halegenticoccus tardaugens]|uniref:site-2 protease family protein n=1 Tax=Halegenticoccus tardaugens TaxID=2071624 RepID=UPI00100B1ED8|nr:site-2 protease family protein [Halegenticoccus tardaugens]